MRGAREEGESLLTAWRLDYKLAPTDPRWTEATEEAILHDLLVKRYHDEHFHRIMHPEEAAIEEMAANPVESGKALERVKKETLANPGVQRALQSLGVGAKQVQKPPGEHRLTIRTSFIKRGTQP